MMKHRIVRLFPIAFVMAVIGSAGSAVAAAVLLALVPIAACKGSANDGSLNFRVWFVAMAMFVVSVLLCSPFAAPWDTIGLMMFSPIFGIVIIGLDSLLAHYFRRW